ncbi:MAG: two-component system, OmpR family, response regulator [Pyrinomonadaceae bacterium]|jgi:DNA-binding response OmpR family regulator|nr:two-component system, OmpR family, response regulator [Pyrinomonadaceae bacterium]
MNSKPPRILFVDDHQDTLDLFVVALSQQHYEVVTASSIEQALQETKVQQFDLLILDSHVGDGSGVDLCRSIRKLDQITPIVFCSGMAYEKDKKEALNAGAQGYLVKPVSIEDLYQTVRQLISNSQQAFNVSITVREDSGNLAVAAVPSI